jgi:ABC-type branched-subunit amino acid transport system ATPase component
MLKVQNLKKHFGGIKAVDNCSFEIKKNSITALIGPNGSGKTTLFNLISGVLKSDSGKIIFDDVDIAGKSPNEISNLGFSRLFQHSRLFSNLTVKENLMLALNNEDTRFWKNLFSFNRTKKTDETKIKKVLELVGMEKFENTNSKDLSYGQKRLIEIVRAILHPHKILMLDEPVAGINPALRKEIAKVLITLKKHEETIFLIEHDLNFTLKLADDIIVMDEGKIIAQGNPSKIRGNKKVIKAYLGD